MIGRHIPNRFPWVGFGRGKKRGKDGKGDRWAGEGGTVEERMR